MPHLGQLAMYQLTELEREDGQKRASRLWYSLLTIDGGRGKRGREKRCT